MLSGMDDSMNAPLESGDSLADYRQFHKLRPGAYD